MNVSSNGAEASSSQMSTTSSGSEDLNDQFLTMFTAQLMNQDPTEPMDANAMVEQLAQISMLEQQEKMNDQLAYLGLTVDNLGNIVSMGLVGDVAHVAVKNFNWDATAGSSVEGKIIVPPEKLEYEYKVDVLDENGNVVSTIEPEVVNGELVFEWDGTDADGNKLPSGDYSFETYYEDVNGARIVDKEATVALTGQIQSMSYWPLSSLTLGNGMTIVNAPILGIENGSDNDATPEPEPTPDPEPEPEPTPDPAP